MFDGGHENPLINNKTSENERNSIIPVSRLGRNTETVIEKKITENRNGMIKRIKSALMPICGKSNTCGITPSIKNDQAPYKAK